MVPPHFVLTHGIFLVVFFFHFPDVRPSSRYGFLQRALGGQHNWSLSRSRQLLKQDRCNTSRPSNYGSLQRMMKARQNRYLLRSHTLAGCMKRASSARSNQDITDLSHPHELLRGARHRIHGPSTWCGMWQTLLRQPNQNLLLLHELLEEARLCTYLSLK